jgi:flagellar hook-associated protein 1 FlgK
MQNYAIGLSGIKAATTALDVIGNNVSNAATEGYHRQRVELAPSSSGNIGGMDAGGGVDVVGVTRLIDDLLEREIVYQESLYGQISQQLSTLSALETTFGEFSQEGGLNATIDAFFDAFRGLAGHPLERVWRNETVSAAQILTSEFRRLGAAIMNMEDQIVLESKNAADSINLLVNQIAALNGKIQTTEITGGEANNLADRRDSLVKELAQLAGIQAQKRDFGVVDVSIGGLPVVTGSLSVPLEIGLQGDQRLGVAAAGEVGYSLDVDGGRVGGLLSLKNDLLPELRTELDALAKAIVSQVNELHVQGLGVAGSFTELTGWTMADDLTDTVMPITDGTFYVRVTDTAAGVVERHAIDVDITGGDTLTAIAGKLDALAGLNSSVTGSRLNVVADLGYTFDFVPAVLPEPTVTNLTAGSPPAVSVSGIYEGEVNDTFTFTVVGAGTIGNGTLRLDVTDGGGDVVSSLNIGAGYAAGDTITLQNGITIAVSTGDVNGGDSFEVDAYATTDTSGLLAAAGMNAFFSGASAAEMKVCEDIVDTPDRIATALGADCTDNVAATRLAALQTESVDSLNGMTPGQYYQRLVANLGQEVALNESHKDNIDAMLQNLKQRQNDMSGVNINDEAAYMLIFEKMFQATAKYLNTLQTAMTTLMELV